MFEQPASSKGKSHIRNKNVNDCCTATTQRINVSKVWLQNSVSMRAAFNEVLCIQHSEQLIARVAEWFTGAGGHLHSEMLYDCLPTGDFCRIKTPTSRFAPTIRSCDHWAKQIQQKRAAEDLHLKTNVCTAVTCHRLLAMLINTEQGPAAGPAEGPAAGPAEGPASEAVRQQMATD